MITNSVAELIQKSNLFDTTLRSTLIGESGLAVPSGARTNAAFAYSKIALEHGSGFQHLLANENPVSALALIRLQYEAVVRGAWIYFAAEDSWMDRFASEAEPGALRESATFPKMRQLLGELSASSADPVLTQSLTALKVKAWDALNSYTHGGLRSIIRTLNGHEEALLLWMLRTSNSLTYVAAQLIARVANDTVRSNRIFDLKSAMSDCMHSQ